jgi:hypothetical protein
VTASIDTPTMARTAMAPAAPQIFASHTTLHIAFVVMLLGALLLTAHCVRDAVRHRSLIPIVAILGGVVALPIEPFWDVNVRFTFATNSSPIAFTAFDRHIPLYLAAIYPAFIGWGSYLGYLAIIRGASKARLAAIPCAFFVADAIIEIVGGKTDLWVYYGHQTFAVADWPAYFGVLNAMIPLVGGLLLATVAPRLTGISRVGTLLIVPSAYVGIYAIAGWPVWFALNADVPRVVDWLAGALLIAICGLVTRLVISTVGTQSPTSELPLAAVV